VGNDTVYEALNKVVQLGEFKDGFKKSHEKFYEYVNNSKATDLEVMDCFEKYRYGVEYSEEHDKAIGEFLANLKWLGSNFICIIC